MSLQSQASLRPTLTVFAQGNMQNRAKTLADILAPTVRVPSTLGQYKRYSDKNTFVTPDTKRAIGGKATRIIMSSDDPTFNCQPHALEIAIDNAEREAAGPNISGLEEGKMLTLLTQAALSHENAVVAIAKTLSATAGKGQWSDKDADPVEELDEEIEAIATATGTMPTNIVFGLGAWRVFRNHPNVKANAAMTSTRSINEQQAAAMFLNPNMSLDVGILSKDTTKFGGTASKVNIVGAEVFIFIRSANPTVYDPSWMKNFSAGDGGIASVRMYPAEDGRADILALDWSEDIQIVSSIAARRVSIT